MPRFFSRPATCPGCAATVGIGQLLKTPCSAQRRWYQLTPAARTSCPHCGRFVVSTAGRSPWLILLYVPMLVLSAGLFVPAVDAAVQGGWWWLLAACAVVGVIAVLRTWRLVADPR